MSTGLQIINDQVLEDTEEFNVMVDTEAPRVTVVPDQGTVIITDDDSKSYANYLCS